MFSESRTVALTIRLRKSASSGKPSPKATKPPTTCRNSSDVVRSFMGSESVWIQNNSTHVAYHILPGNGEWPSRPGTEADHRGPHRKVRGQACHQYRLGRLGNPAHRERHSAEKSNTIPGWSRTESWADGERGFGAIFGASPEQRSPNRRNTQVDSLNKGAGQGCPALDSPVWFVDNAAIPRLDMVGRAPGCPQVISDLVRGFEDRFVG